MPRGLLLVNLGTPDAPRTPEVRRYLSEFLSDPYVIDLNPVSRWLLLHLVILPRRPAKSAELYQRIWTAGGSPLLVHGVALAAAVGSALRGEFEVALAMRYGKPTLAGGLAALKARGVTEVTVLPLYPQYATSTTQSTVDQVRRIAARDWPEASLQVVPSFFAHPGFLGSYAEVARPVIAASRAEHVLFSFHGLPTRQLTRLDHGHRHCLQSPTGCQTLEAANRDCYRAQAIATARALAERLSLPEDGYSIGFQSRFGKQWIEPFTDLQVLKLARRKVGRLAVLCPAFVADCLETLEEIGIRARESFKAAGGEELTLVPSLNSHPSWVSAVAELARASNSSTPLSGSGS